MGFPFAIAIEFFLLRQGYVKNLSRIQDKSLAVHMLRCDKVAEVFGKERAGPTEAVVWGLHGAQYFSAKTKMPSVSTCECTCACERKVCLILRDDPAEATASSG